MKLKRLPSLKEKKRYLHFKIVTNAKNIPYFELKNVLWNAVMSWIGERGAGKSNFRIIKNLWDEKKFEGVISCTPKSVDDIKIALATIRYIGDSNIIFNVVRVSGTIKSIKEKEN